MLDPIWPNLDADGGVASGVSNIRGWAIASEGVSAVEIFIDGELAFEIPYGGERKDVENTYPDRRKTNPNTSPKY